MPTEIKIVMPATEDDDTVSDNEATPSRNSVQPGASEKSTNRVESSCVHTRPERSKSAHSGKRPIRTRHRTRLRKGEGPGFEKPAEVPFHTAHLQYLNENLEQTYDVFVNKQLPDTHSKVKKVKESPTKPQEVHVSITAGYAKSTNSIADNNRKPVNVFQAQALLKRSSVIQPPDNPSLVTTNQTNRRRSVPSSNHSVRFADDKMTDIPHSNNFLRRNKTTHLWTDGSQLMSRSLPTSSFIHQRLGGSASSSPRSSRDANSEKTSPAAGKLAPGRPSSSYSYDGGFFLGAHSGHAEYFVIHPDWVSEAVTIKKLSIGNKTSGVPVTKSASFNKGGIWSGRRCLSAPPAKRRNPITWDAPDTVDVQEKRY